MSLSHSRKRSYQDLSPDEKKLYDELRTHEKSARKEHNASRETRCREEADAMLGLSRFDDNTFGKPWRHSSEPVDYGVRSAGTSRDMGHQ